MPGMRRGGVGRGVGRRGVAAAPARRGMRRQRRRTLRRMRRRRVIIGGALVFAIGNSAHKMSKQEAEKIEQSAGKPVDQLTEDELHAQMDTLGIEGQEVSDSDAAALESDQLPEGVIADSEEEPVDASSESSSDYTADLEKLADLHKQGILTDDEFAAKKKQILGL